MPTATLKTPKAIGISPAVRSWTASIHTPKPMRMAERRHRALTDRVSSVFLIVSNPSRTSSNTPRIAGAATSLLGGLSLQLAQASAPSGSMPPCLTPLGEPLPLPDRERLSIALWDVARKWPLAPTTCSGAPRRRLVSKNTSHSSRCLTTSRVVRLVVDWDEA
jgi:hypothetical protein